MKIGGGEAMNMNGPNDLMAAPVGELLLEWFLFKARGPMANVADRFDILNFTMNKKKWRWVQTESYWSEEGKDNSHDFAVGIGDSGCGMAMGATCKDLALVAQSKMKLDQMKRASRISQLSSTLNSKNKWLESMVSTVDTMKRVGLKDKATAMAASIPSLVEMIKKLVTELEH